MAKSKKDTIDVSEIKSLPVAIETIEELLKEKETTGKKTELEINALASKIDVLEKAVAEAKKTGAIKTGHGTAGVASQFLNVRK